MRILFTIKRQSDTACTVHCLLALEAFHTLNEKEINENHLNENTILNTGDTIFNHLDVKKKGEYKEKGGIGIGEALDHHHFSHQNVHVNFVQKICLPPSTHYTKEKIKKEIEEFHQILDGQGYHANQYLRDTFCESILDLHAKIEASGFSLGDNIINDMQACLETGNTDNIKIFQHNIEVNGKEPMTLENRLQEILFLFRKEKWTGFIVQAGGHNICIGKGKGENNYYAYNPANGEVCHLSDGNEIIKYFKEMIVKAGIDTYELFPVTFPHPSLRSSHDSTVVSQTSSCHIFSPPMNIHPFYRFFLRAQKEIEACPSIPCPDWQIPFLEVLRTKLENQKQYSPFSVIRSCQEAYDTIVSKFDRTDENEKKCAVFLNFKGAIQYSLLSALDSTPPLLPKFEKSSNSLPRKHGKQ